MKLTHKVIVLSGLIFTIGLTLVGCKEEPIGMGSEPDKAKVIFINASVNDFTNPTQARREIAVWPFYNGVQFNLFPIKFPWSNGYKVFAPGNMVMRLDTANSPGNDPSQAALKVTEINFNTQADKYYSVYAVGPSRSVEALVLEDDLTPPTSGKAKIRLMNYSFDAGPIDIVIKGGATLATGLRFKEIKNFFEIDPGIYTIDIIDSNTKAIINSKTSVIIDAKSVYSIWARGMRTLPSPGNTSAGYVLGISYHANRWGIL
jgi:hypothetical protein